jgi:hypothetical protein
VLGVSFSSHVLRKEFLKYIYIYVFLKCIALVAKEGVCRPRAMVTAGNNFTMGLKN